MSKRMHSISEVTAATTTELTRTYLLTWWLVVTLIIGSFFDCIMSVLTYYLVKLIRLLPAVNVSYWLFINGSKQSDLQYVCLGT